MDSGAQTYQLKGAKPKLITSHVKAGGGGGVGELVQRLILGMCVLNPREVWLLQESGRLGAAPAQSQSI